MIEMALSGKIIDIKGFINLFI